MNDLEDARQKWLAERPQYEEFAKILATKMQAVLQPLGIWFEVDQRTKQIDSLIKKLLKKSTYSYNSLPDKVGIRVTVRYLSDVPKVTKKIKTSFGFVSVDSKEPKYDSIGYRSVHIHKVSLKKSDPDRKEFPVRRFWAELQVRTQAQHLWSEMSHGSIYKNDETVSALSNDVRRRVHLMAGQLEVADREFERLAAVLPVTPAADLLHFLEPYYFSFSSRRPNVELSLDILEILAPLYGADLAIAKDTLRAFIERNRAFLDDLYALKQQPEEINLSPLLFQPEALALYERLKDDIVGLRRAWTTTFPEKELGKLASTFGMNID